MTICLVLFVLGLLLLVAAFRVKKGKTWLFILAGVCLLELTAALAYRAKNGYLIYNQISNENHDLFEADPYTVCKLKANIDTIIKGKHVLHNQHGWRSLEETNLKNPVVCIGGSTTYCVGVANKDTWPYVLQKKLGDTVSVINLGVPGHTTNEHFATMLYELPNIQPQAIIFHVGLNDMRLSYLANQTNNYRKHHAAALYQSVGLDYRGNLPRIALAHVLSDVCVKLGLAPTPWLPETIAASNPVETKKQLQTNYKNHLEQLITLAKQYTNNIVFVPQVLIPEAFFNQQYAWWAPFIPDNQLVPLMDEFNTITKKIALANNCQYINAIDNIPFTINHFTDPSHLNEEGLKWFVDSLVTNLILK
jgi:hypothetical protein